MKNSRALWIAVLGCIMLRMVLFGVFAPWRAEVEQSSLLASDAQAYHACTLNLRNSGIYSCTAEVPSQPDNVWPPAFSFLSYCLFSITGVKPWLMLMVNICLDVITLVAILCICRSIWCSTIGTIAACLFALNPIAITNAMGYRPDTLFQCVCALFVMAWVSYVASPTSSRVLMSALLLGLSSLCKPITQYMTVVVVLMVWVNAWYRACCRGVLVRSLVFVVAVGVVLAPWCLRNYRCFKTVNLTSMEGASLCDFAAANVIADQHNTDIATARASLMALLVQRNDITLVSNMFAQLATTNVAWSAQLVSPTYLQPTAPRTVLKTRADIARAQKHLFTAFVSRNWCAYGRVSLMRMVRMLMTPPWQEMMRMLSPTLPSMELAKAIVSGNRAVIERIGWMNAGLSIVLAAVLSLYTVCFPLLALWGLALMLRSQATRQVAVNMLVLCAYFIVLVGPQGEPRYNLLVIPMTTPMAARGMYAIYQYVCRRRSVRAGKADSPQHCALQV